jgi:hypothetical protein
LTKPINPDHRSVLLSCHAVGESAFAFPTSFS